MLSPSPSLRRGLEMPQPHSHRGGPPRPSQLPSGISWRSSHRAHAGFWKSVGTHSLLILSALKKNVVDKIHGAVGPCLCSRMGMGWKTDVQGPRQCCQMLWDGHCLDDVDCVLQQRPPSERNSGWRSRAWEVDLGRPGHAALDRGLCGTSSATAVLSG